MGNGTMRSAFLPFLILFLTIHLLPTTQSIWLSLPESGTKCVSEEIHSNVIVLADYVVIAMEQPHHQTPTISVKVSSPFGNNLHHNENVTSGQFAFTASETGTYLACFSLDKHQQGIGDVSVNIEWKTGIAAKDWESVAKIEKIEGIELELKKLEGAVEGIHENLRYLKTRESEMRTVSEKTNGKVAKLSLMSLGICIVVSGVQIVYLKRFFQKKKLI